MGSGVLGTLHYFLTRPHNPRRLKKVKRHVIVSYDTSEVSHQQTAILKQEMIDLKDTILPPGSIV